MAGKVGVRMWEAGRVVPHFAGMGNPASEAVGHPVVTYLRPVHDFVDWSLNGLK